MNGYTQGARQSLSTYSQIVREWQQSYQTQPADDPPTAHEIADLLVAFCGEKGRGAAIRRRLHQGRLCAENGICKV